MVEIHPRPSPSRNAWGLREAAVDPHAQGHAPKLASSAGVAIV